MTTKEKRQDDRHSVNIPVDITVQDHFYHGWVKTVAKDVVFVETEGAFSVGQKLSFYFLGENKFATVIRVKSQGIVAEFG